MYCDSANLRRVRWSVLPASAVACFAAGCSDITPEPNDEGGGVVVPTDEADQLREGEEREGGEGGRR